MSDAFIVVDLQNDFANPKGKLYVEGGEKVAPVVNQLMKFFDLAIFTLDWHPTVTTHFADHGGPWPEHCVENTWGAELVKELKVPKRVKTMSVLKGTDPGADGYSGFSVEKDGETKRTALHDLLQAAGVDAVFVAGIALDVCVKATCLDAVALGYDTYLYIDATAAVTEEGAEQAERELRAAGVHFI